jgi:PAS domain S-box-containing protein
MATNMGCERGLPVSGRGIGEVALRSERRARMMLDHTTDLIALLTLEGVVVDVNQPWEAVLGLDPTQLVGRHVSEFALPGQAEQLFATFREAVATEAAHVVVPLRHVTTAAVVHVEFSHRRVQLDGDAFVIAIGRDITHELDATRRLAEAEQLYRTLIEQVPDIVWRASASGEFLFITPNVATITGFTPDQLCADSKLWFSRVHPDDIDAVAAALGYVMSHRSTFDQEYRFRTRDDRWIWLRTRVNPDRERATFEGLTSDVTAKRVLEQSLAQAQKMEAVGQLSGGIAHDFNNLLAVILANSCFLLEDLNESDPRRNDAEEIKAAAERAASLTRQLLAFSRRQVLEMVVVDVNAVVNGLGKMLRRLIGEDIAFSLVEGSSIGSIKADVGQLEQVIVNLVVNARDAMPHGGKLVIETSNVDIEPGSTVVGIPAGEYVQLSISDTGTGMTAETKRRLFEPFYTTKERGKGTGLGLSTCHGIVHQFGGHICVYSELGRGTVFKVFLPRLATVERPLRPRSQTIDTRGTETLLLVEDEEQVRSAFGRMLAHHGYRVVVASDCEEALALIRAAASPFDLIISDVVMPKTSGLELVELARGLAPTSRVLLMSGFTDHAMLGVDISERGFNFLQKPFAPATLTKKVRQILDGA